MDLVILDSRMLGYFFHYYCSTNTIFNMKAELKKFWESIYGSSISLVDEMSTPTTIVEDTDNEYLQWMNQKRGIRATDNKDELDGWDSVLVILWCQRWLSTSILSLRCRPSQNVFLTGVRIH